MTNESSRLIRSDIGHEHAANPPPPSGARTCPACAGAETTRTYEAPSAYVYALGRVEPRFPTLAVEKEFAQAVGKAQKFELSDRVALQAVLTRSENAYLVRQLCWVFTVEGMEAYVVVPPASDDGRQLVQSLRPMPRRTDLDVLIGTVGPVVSGRACNGLSLPSVALAQLAAFNGDELANRLPRPKESADAGAAVQEVLHAVLQLTENPGVRADHRAINYLAARDPSIYAAVAHRLQHDEALVGIEVHSSALATTRDIKEVVFTFRRRSSDAIHRLYARVDTTELFPFLVSKLAPYTER